MSREALVVGINRYPLLKDKPGGKPRHLIKPAADAEAMAQVLETYGNFRVERFPSIHQDGSWQVDPNPTTRKLPKATQLKKAISQLFNPPTSVPDTALLFFAGHGLLDDSSGMREGFLAASDTNPLKNNWGVSLRWLRQLLQASPVRQQIVWLDCCHSGALLNFGEGDPGTVGKARDRCFIAAARDFEVAYEQVGEAHGVLTGSLLPGLNPDNHPSSWVTNYSLVDYLNQQLKSSRQRPLFHNTGGEILLTGEIEKMEQAVLMAGVCPYKGLEPFDFNSEDAQYFYGRTALTDELLELVRCSNFLAIVGASGSGKSSLVKAGLLHQLKLGTRLSGSHSWLVVIFRPGQNPRSNLAAALTSEVDEDGKSYIQRGPEGLAELIELIQAKVTANRLILLADQFEEVFTLTENEEEREKFFHCLLRGLELAGNKLCLILTMRADFLGKCAEQEYGGLVQKIKDNLIPVTPMNQEELAEAITEPAKKVGLEVERELVELMLKDVKGPASLPLLQYTLTELWRRRQVNRLTLAEYSKLGGVNGALRQRADEVYKELTAAEQLAAKRIFLNLTQLGEGTEDTRRQVLKEDLIDKQESAELIEGLLQKLADARLVVTSQLQARGRESEEDTVTAVDVAHEALIRHWPQLRSWMNEHRDTIRIERKIDAAAVEWIKERKSPSYLLAGPRLSEAENYLQDYHELGLLSSTGQEFIACSIQRQRHNRRMKLLTGAAFVGFMVVATLVSVGFAINARISEKEAEKATLIEKAARVEHLLSVNPVDALVLAIAATEYSKRELGEVLPEVENSLLAAIQVIREQDRFASHESEFGRVVMSPNGEYIATTNDNTIQLWDRNGNKLGKPLVGHTDVILTLAISPDGEYIVSGSADNTVRLWDREGNSKVLPGHGDKVWVVAISPDGEYIVSGSQDQTLRLWDRMGNKIGSPLTGHEGSIYTASFTPDGQYIISGSLDSSLRKWDLNGNLVGQPIQGKYPITSLAISPDGKYIVSGDAGNILQLWDINGKAIGAPFQAHEAFIFSIAFSPDGRYILSGSWDRTIRWWNLSGQQIGSPFVGHEGGILSMAFTPNGELISSGNDGTLRFWQLEGNLAGPSFRGHSEAVLGVAFSPDGEYVVSAGEDKTLRLWTKDGQAIGEPWLGHEGGINAVAFSPDGEYIVSGSDDETLRLWTKDGEAVGEPWLGHEKKVTAVAFSPDGKHIISGSKDKTLRLWSKDGQPIGQPWSGHEEGINAVAFSPDGQYIVSGSNDGIVRLWNKDGESIGKPFTGHKGIVTAIAFSPDGEYILSGSTDDTLRLWDKNGNQIGKPFIGHKDVVTSVAFALQGESLYIVSGSQDKTVRLWNKDGETIGLPFTRHHRGVNAVAVNSDGSYIISASNDKTLQSWRLKGLQDLLKIGCEQLRHHPVLLKAQEPKEAKKNKKTKEAQEDPATTAAEVCKSLDKKE